MESSEQAPAIREPDVSFVGAPDALGELFAALAQAQAEFPPIVKDSTAKVTMKVGGSYTFDYAGLDVVIAATAPALTKHGLAMMQFPCADELLTVLAKGSARIESRCAIPKWADAQAFGSTITYFKRYARLSILSCFPAQEDDDGGAASGHKAVITARSPNPPQPKPAAATVAGALLPATKARIGDVSKKVGFNREDLEAFSHKNQCGPLADLTELDGLRLVGALEAMQVKP